ncbi:MAG: MATE family efflux transporter, partial [Arenibacterium sp.]
MSLPSLSIMAVSMIANGALRAQGDGARSMFVTLTSGSVAMVIDPILIYGLSLGLDGAAIGLNISRCVMMFMALRFAIGTHDLLAVPAIRDVAATLRPYMGIAIPAILTQMATPAGNYLMTTVMARFGDDAVAGWAVVGRLTVVAFGGIFSLSGAIGGIFGQNYGAGQYERLKTAYRDAIIFGLIYTGVTWIVLIAVSSLVITSFQLTQIGADVVHAFVYVGAGGFVFAAALFVSNAAFNALGRPGRSTFTNWMRDGILLLPLCLLFAGWSGPGGVIYARAAANPLVGALAAFWGWRYVQSMQQAPVDAAALEPPRPHAHADRFRRR